LHHGNYNTKTKAKKKKDWIKYAGGSEIEESLGLRLGFERNGKLFGLGGLDGGPLGSWEGEKSLGLADGPGLLELDDVSHFELIIWVVGLVLLLLPEAPLVLWVNGHPDHLHCHRLIAAGAHNLSLHCLHGLYLGHGTRGCPLGPRHAGIGFGEKVVAMGVAVQKWS